MDTWSPDDQSLARRAHAGDGVAFGQLVERYQDPVYRLCVRYVGAHEAEDLAQDAFVRAFVHRRRYDPARPMRPWLLAIARRLCIDRGRRKKAEPLDDEGEVVDQGTDTERDLATRQELALVSAALGTLAEGPREAVSLYHLEGLAYQEIADVLEVPIGTVMTWLHRGRARLKAALAERSSS